MNNHFIYTEQIIRWNKITEVVPQEGMYVLVMDEQSGDWDKVLCYFSNKDEKICAFLFDHSNINVTHWAYLF